MRRYYFPINSITLRSSYEGTREIPTPTRNRKSLCKTYLPDITLSQSNSWLARKNGQQAIKPLSSNHENCWHIKRSINIILYDECRGVVDLVVPCDGR